MKNYEDVLDYESRKEQRRKRRKRQRRRRIFAFLLSVLTVALAITFVGKIKAKKERERLLKARNESFVGAPPFDVDLLTPNEYSRPERRLKILKGLSFIILRIRAALQRTIEIILRD